MKTSDEIYRRYLLFLPINDNTKQNICDIINHIYNVAGGCTYSRFHNPPLILNDEQETELFGYFIGKFKEYENEDIVYLITNIKKKKIEEIPELHNQLKKLINKIEELGEDAVWLTYHDIKLCK